MKIMGGNSLSTVIKIGLIILFVFGVLVFISLPLIVNEYISILRPKYANLFIAILYAPSIPALVIVYEFIKLFTSLQKSTPFIRENSKSLKVCSVCSLIIWIELSILSLIFQSIFLMIMIGCFLIAWLALYILSELFKQAVEYKEENDLTI